MPAAQVNDEFKDALQLIVPPSPMPRRPKRPPKPHPRPARRTTIQNVEQMFTTSLTTTTNTISNFDTANSTSTLKRERKKSCTELLCELTRLKAQQKYLECNQVKLKLENFQDIDTTSAETSFSSLLASSPSPSSAAVATAAAAAAVIPPTLPASTTSTGHLINEIEQLKIDLNTKLSDSRNVAKLEVRDLSVLVHAIRDDVKQKDRLRLFTLPAIRERIIGINKHLEFLRAKNKLQREQLQKDFLTLERDVKLRFK